MSKVSIALGGILLLAGAAYGYTQVSAPQPYQSQSAPIDGIAQAQTPAILNVIARTGPWPYASRLIGYRGRLWFAASVKYRNHNSADIWSMDPQTLEKRLEHNLFSQDAGLPVVYNDLLYWPLEDALLANGNGAIAATNGENWQTHIIDTALIYHTSEAQKWKDGLLVITGSRNAGLQFTKDGGNSWSEVYDHETPRTHVSRIRDMVVWNDELYATLRDVKTQRLVKWTGSSFETVKAWPLNRRVRGLTLHNDAIYAIIGRGKDAEIWNYDGQTAKNLGHKAQFVDIASDGAKLWTVTNDGDLLSINDDGDWQRHQNIDGGVPYEITAIDGAIYIAGAGDDKRSIIWGPKQHIISNGPQIALNPQYPSPRIYEDWDALGTEIDAIISDVNSYNGRRNPKLGALMDRAISLGAPDGFYAKRFDAHIPDIKISTFGGNAQTKASDIIQIMLLRGMAQSGHKNVPIELLNIPWTAPQNKYEKYLSLPLSALKTIADTGQNDDATINALIARLDYDDPDWFQSQVIGTLTAITGEHHGYDIAAWKAWHKG